MGKIALVLIAAAALASASGSALADHRDEASFPPWLDLGISGPSVHSKAKKPHASSSRAAERAERQRGALAEGSAHPTGETFVYD